MDKGLLSFLLVFVALIGASLAFANTDQITPAVAQAQAEIAVGPSAVQALEQSVSWVAKFMLAGFFAGIAAAVFAEARKAYKAWKRNSQARRWQAGPNAQWKQPTEAGSRLTRNDLLLLALSGRYPADQLRTSLRPGVKRTASSDDNDIPMEF